MSAPEAGGLTDWAPLLDALPDAAWLVALPSLAVVAANAAAARCLALDREALLRSRADQLLATPEDLAYWNECTEWSEQAERAGSDAPHAAAPMLDSDTLLAAADGQVRPVRRSIRPLDTGGARAGTALALVWVRDESVARAAQIVVDQGLAELRAALEATADGILVTDLTGHIRGFNRRFAELWQIPAELMAMQRDDSVLEWMRRSVHDPQEDRRRLQALHDAPLLAATERVQLLTGRVLERTARPMWSRGRPLGRVFSFRELNREPQAEAPAQVLLRTDPLTGLPNRHNLTERISHAALSMRHEGDGFALLLVDLDRFRRVNDSFGHAHGDRLLCQAADRIRRCLREGDVLARAGDDRFALMLRHTDAAAAEAAAQRVIDAVGRPWQDDGLPLTLTCSVGVALCPGHGRGADELLRHAEAAARAARHAGGNGLRFHHQRASADLRQHLQLDHAMRLALAGNRMRLHFQPQVALKTGRVVGAEALIRWRDAALGDVAPERFIPVAEDTGFIVAIDDWVLAQAARQASEWARSGLDLPLAINVSALQFRQPRFVDRVAAALREHRLAPDRLELELTESVLSRDPDDALLRLHALAALGVRLSIDDFGSGHSSLSYLKRFPVHQLKIDRSLVQGLPDDEHAAAVVRAVVQVARALGREVVAEGVETEPQRQFLFQAGCDRFQGFLFAPAMDALSLAGRLRLAPAVGPAVGPAPTQRLAVVLPMPRR